MAGSISNVIITLVERCVFLADSFVRFDGCCSISVIERVPKKDVENGKKAYTSWIFSFILTKNISVRDNNLKEKKNGILRRKTM